MKILSKIIIRIKSPYAKIKKSGIHHLGVFAVKDIPKKTRIIEYVGKKITKERADKIYDESFAKHEKNKNYGSVYIFELNKKHDVDGNVYWNPAKYINHSCNPNCETDIINDKIWIISIKKIKKGEEITYNYGYDIDDYKNHSCNCGSKKCVGYIVNDEQWPKLRKLLKKEKIKNHKKSSKSWKKK